MGKVKASLNEEGCINCDLLYDEREPLATDKLCSTCVREGLTNFSEGFFKEVFFSKDDFMVSWRIFISLIKSVISLTFSASPLGCCIHIVSQIKHFNFLPFLGRFFLSRFSFLHPKAIAP